MAFDREANKLSDILAGGYHLTAKLLALLGHPLDSQGQEEAMACSQELSRVFAVSMSMLNKQPDYSNWTLKVAPEIRSGDSFSVCTLAPNKEKLVSRRQGVTSHRNVRREEFERKEVTPSPHKDGYQWHKYGQKNIQNCSFMRYYFRCHNRRCGARKKVQKLDDGDAPMYEVTYVNDHTCRVVVPHDDANNNNNSSPPPTTTTTSTVTTVAENTTGRNSGGGAAPFDGLLHHRIIGGGGSKENEAIVSCLATVISGGSAPSSPAGAGPPTSSSDPPQHVPQQLLLAAGRRTSSGDDDGSVADGGVAMAMMTTGTGFSWDPSSSSLFWPAEAATDLCDDEQMDMDVARFVDTVWPQYNT